MNKIDPNHGMGWNKPDESQEDCTCPLTSEGLKEVGHLQDCPLFKKTPDELREQKLEDDICAVLEAQYGDCFARKDIMSLVAAHTAKAVAEAEKRGAAYAMCNLSYKTAMDGRKTVKASWIDSKGEDWAISAVKYAQANNMPIIGYNQFARDFNEKHPTSKSSNSAPSPAQENE